MDLQDYEKIKEVWRQDIVPVLFRNGRGHPLLVKLPYNDNNRLWLKKFGHRIPYRNAQKKCWEVPKAWFNDLVTGTLNKWGKVYIIQPFREQEKCAPACWHALGHECQCSCMGANHGSQSSGSGWYVVSETFATKWNDAELACRLLISNAIEKI